MPDTLTMVTIKVSGEVTEKQIKPDDIEAIGEAVGDTAGGYIEQVPLFRLYDHNGTIHPCVAFCHEEGELKDMPVNREATLRWASGLASRGMRLDDRLVGDVAIVFGDPELMAEL